MSSAHCVAFTHECLLLVSGYSTCLNFCNPPGSHPDCVACAALSLLHGNQHPDQGRADREQDARRRTRCSPGSVFVGGWGNRRTSRTFVFRWQADCTEQPPRRSAEPPRHCPNPDLTQGGGIVGAFRRPNGFQRHEQVYGFSRRRTHCLFSSQVPTASCTCRWKGW